MIYGAINQDVLAHVPRTASRLLDIGCGTGALGRKIKEEIACQVVGITCSESEAALAAKYLDTVLVRDLNSFDPSEAGQFDCVVCSHVLEHLYHPDQFLKRLRWTLSPDGVVIVALPNALHWRQRLEYLRGHFKYTDGGLIDETHYRFFDWQTARALLVDCGYTVLQSKACGTFPLSRYFLQPGRQLDRVALKVSPGLFGFQFIFVCQPCLV